MGYYLLSNCPFSICNEPRNLSNFYDLSTTITFFNAVLPSYEDSNHHRTNDYTTVTTDYKIQRCDEILIFGNVAWGTDYKKEMYLVTSKRGDISYQIQVQASYYNSPEAFA
jgi:hypothetical protein